MELVGGCRVFWLCCKGNLGIILGGVREIWHLGSMHIFPEQFAARFLEIQQLHPMV